MRPDRARIDPPPSLPNSAPLPGIGHNGGPPLEDPHVPEWGTDGIGNYFEWKASLAAAFNDVPYDTAIRRARKAEQLGLTYNEYTLEILERGRHLQIEDAERIAAIKARRPASPKQGGAG